MTFTRAVKWEIEDDSGNLLGIVRLFEGGYKPMLAVRGGLVAGRGAFPDGPYYRSLRGAVAAIHRAEARP